MRSSLVSQVRVKYRSGLRPSGPQGPGLSGWWWGTGHTCSLPFWAAAAGGEQPEEPMGTRAEGGSWGQEEGGEQGGGQATRSGTRLPWSEPGIQGASPPWPLNRSSPVGGPGTGAQCLLARKGPLSDEEEHLRGCFVLLIGDQRQVPPGWESSGSREPAGSREGPSLSRCPTGRAPCPSLPDGYPGQPGLGDLSPGVWLARWLWPHRRPGLRCTRK